MSRCSGTKYTLLLNIYIKYTCACLKTSYQLTTVLLKRLFFIIQEWWSIAIFFYYSVYQLQQPKVISKTKCNLHIISYLVKTCTLFFYTYQVASSLYIRQKGPTDRYSSFPESRSRLCVVWLMWFINYSMCLQCRPSHENWLCGNRSW